MDQQGDVITMSKRGQWVNRVEGEEELSQDTPRRRRRSPPAGRWPRPPAPATA